LLLKLTQEAPLKHWKLEQLIELLEPKCINKFFIWISFLWIEKK